MHGLGVAIWVTGTMAQILNLTCYRVARWERDQAPDPKDVCAYRLQISELMKSPIGRSSTPRLPSRTRGILDNGVSE